MLRVIEYFTKSLKVIETGTIRELGHGFLFVFRSNYGSFCIISETKRDISRKSRFSHTFLHLTPPLGGIRRYGKTRMVWLPDGEKKSKDMFCRFDRILACDGQMDRRVDKRTDRHLATA